MLPPLFLSVRIPTLLALFWHKLFAEKPRSGLPHRGPMSIIIFRLDAMGDVVMTTPLFRELKRAFPKSRCTVVVQNAFRPLLVTNPHIDEILAPPQVTVTWLPRRVRNLLSAMLLYWRCLRLRQFDVAISPRWDADEHFATLLCPLTNAAERVGYTEKASPVKQRLNRGFDAAFSICLPAGPVRHEVVRNLVVLEALGGTVQDSSLELRLTERDRDFATRLLANIPLSTRLIGLGIGAQSAGRQWPLQRYAECVNHLAQQISVRAVIVCSAAESEQALRLAKLLNCGPIILSGSPLRETCAVLEHCDLFFGNDSGSAHLAAAMDCRTIVISRHPRDGDPNHSNSPLRFGPYCKTARVLPGDWVGQLYPQLSRSGATLHHGGLRRRGGRGRAENARQRCGSERQTCRHEEGLQAEPRASHSGANGRAWCADLMPPSFLTSRHRRIVKAVWSGAAARVLCSALTLISLPLAVRYLGAERYGVWAIITSTVVWINLLDLGIANTLTNHISRAFALDDKPSAARYFTNALALTAGVSVIAGTAFSAAFQHINWVALFNVSAKVRAGEVNATVAAAAALMLLGLPGNLAGKVLAGYQELHRNNFAICAGAVANVAGLALGIVLRVSMPVLFVMSAGCLTFASLATLFVTVLWTKPWLRPRTSFLDCSTVKELLNSGSSFFLIQVAAVIVFSSDNLVVSHYLGAAEVTPYSVTWRLVGLAALLQSLIFPALWPAYAEAYMRRDYGWIRHAFSLTMKGTIVLNLACVLLFVLFGRTVIRLWAGPAAVPTTYLLLAMGVWALISGFMSVESCLLAALNRTREQAVLSIVTAVVNIVLSIALVQHIGSVGVIGGTILSYLFVLVVPQSMIVRSLFERELAQRTEGAASNVGDAKGRVMNRRSLDPASLRSG